VVVVDAVGTAHAVVMETADVVEVADAALAIAIKK
jgi:hypothetical protein